MDMKNCRIYVCKPILLGLRNSYDCLLFKDIEQYKKWETEHKDEQWTIHPKCGCCEYFDLFKLNLSGLWPSVSINRTPSHY